MALEHVKHGLSLELASQGKPLVLVAEIDAGGQADTLDRDKKLLMALVDAVNHLRADGRPCTEAQIVLACNTKFRDEHAEVVLAMVKFYITNILDLLKQSGENFDIARLDVIPNGDFDMCVLLTRTTV